jgi:hypothetical protein
MIQARVIEEKSFHQTKQNKCDFSLLTPIFFFLSGVARLGASSIMIG